MGLNQVSDLIQLENLVLDLKPFGCPFGPHLNEDWTWTLLNSIWNITLNKLGAMSHQTSQMPMLSFVWSVAKFHTRNTPMGSDSIRNIWVWRHQHFHFSNLLKNKMNLWYLGSSVCETCFLPISEAYISDLED